MKKALIIGTMNATGDYLRDLLGRKGYEVHRFSSELESGRPLVQEMSSETETQGVRGLIHSGDLRSFASLVRLIRGVRPDEIYNFTSSSKPHQAFIQPEIEADVTALGVLRILEALRVCGLENVTRFYQDSTSKDGTLTGFSPPQSSYAVSKLFGYWMAKNYREAYVMYVCNGNHVNGEILTDDPLARKIARSLSLIKLGVDEKLILPLLDTTFSWGHSRDYAQTIWTILQQSGPQDYIVRVGHRGTIREFLQQCVSRLQLQLTWHGSGLDEQGNSLDGKSVVLVDQRSFRSHDAESSIESLGPPERFIGCEPSLSFEALVAEMVDAELHLAQRERLTDSSK